MPKINVNLNDIGELIGRKLSIDELESLLYLVKAEVKEYDKSSGDIKLGLEDTNRPDLWSAEGISRQIRVYENGKGEEYDLFSSATDETHKIEIDPALVNIRPYIGAFIARGVRVTEPLLIQLIESQEKLCENYGRKRRSIAIGIYNCEKIKFPVHYHGHAPKEKSFVPLGMEQEMDLSQILEKHPKGVEYRYILEGFSIYPLIYDSEGKVLSFPPVINSRDVGEVKVGESNLFIEATGTDQNSVIHSLNIMAANLADRGAKIESVLSIYPYDTPLGREVRTPYPFETTISLEESCLEGLLGIKTTVTDIKKILKRYGLKVNSHANKIDVSIPFYRLDYMHSVDVVEDFAISYGYNSFEPVMPQRFTVGRLSPTTLWMDQVRDLMIGFGFEEMISNILLNSEELNTKMNLNDGLVEIENVMSSTYSALRNNLLPCLLRAEAVSAKALYPHKLFEVGEAGILALDENLGSRTINRLSALLAHPDATFSELHSYLDLLLYYLGASLDLEPLSHPSFIEGRCGQVIAQGKNIGLIGEVHPAVLDKWDIKVPCSAFEINLDVLLSLCQV